MPCAHPSSAALLERVRVGWQRFRLENGLTILVHEDRRAPLVSVEVCYLVGSKDEPPGQSGLAHLCEHLMFAGSENFAGAYLARMREAGAIRVNGETSLDLTRFFQLVPTGMLDYALFAEADRMGHLHPCISQEVLDQQREIVLQEQRQREEAPGGRIHQRIAEGLYPVGHPYRRPVIGSMEDLCAASVEDVRAWCRTHYAPSNAVLVIAGDVDAATVGDNVARQFAHIPPGAPLFRPGPWLERRTAQRCDRLEDRLSKPGLLFLAWTVPGAAHPEAEHLGLAATMLGGGRTSRLFRDLVDPGHATAISANVWCGAVCGQFTISVTLAEGFDMHEAERRVREIVAGVLAEPIHEAELDRIRTSQLTGMVRSLDDIERKGSLLASGEAYFADPDAHLHAARRLVEARPSDVTAAAASSLSAEPYVLHVRPFGTLRAVGTVASRRRAPDISAEAAPIRGLAIEQAYLPNGLRILHTPLPGGSGLHVRLLVNHGYGCEPDRLHGITALMTALPQYGVGTRDAAALADVLASTGMGLQVGCDPSSFTVELAGFLPSLGDSLDLLGDIVLRPRYESAAFERQKEIEIARLAREAGSPLVFASMLPARLLYGGAHPFVRSPGGLRDSLEALSVAGIEGFHGRLFDPAQATLIVAGDVPLDTLVGELERRLAPWKRPEKPLAKPDLPAPPAWQQRICLVNVEGVAQSAMRCACLVPPFGAIDELAFAAMNEVLGGGFTSRLSMNLRETRQWTYGIASTVWDPGDPRVPRILSIEAAVEARHTADCVREVLAEMRDLSGPRPVATTELEAFRRGEQMRLATMSSSAGRAVGAIDFLARRQLPLAYWSDRANALKRLCREDVDAAARAVLDPGRARWVIAGDAASLKHQIDEAGLGSVVVMDAEDRVTNP